VSAIHAGASQVDCSLSPVSGGTCQPDLLTLWQALRGSEYDLGIDVEKIREVERVFAECMEDYFVPPEALSVEPVILFSPMPGGALTANTQMMRDNGILDRYPEVIQAMSEVVARGGFGTSVTPVSQFYFQQAFNNVMFGPWERMAEGYGKMVLGYFGKTPVEPDPEIVERASELLELEPTVRAPIDINDDDPKKGVDAAKQMLTDADLPHTDENVFIAATCREKGLAFLQGKAHVNVRKKEPDEKPDAVPTGERAEPESDSYSVTINGRTHRVTVKDGHAVVDGVRYDVDVAPASGSGSARGTTSSAAGDGADARQGEQTPAAGGREGETGAATTTATGELQEVTAPFAGLVLRVEAEPGAHVEKGASVVVLESMKMESVLSAPIEGTVQTVRFSSGEQVKSGDVVAVIRAS
jgi:pyruvate carboxylase subunit B